MGAYHGKASFDTFSHTKSVLTKPTRPDPNIAYPPYTKLKERLIRRFLSESPRDHAGPGGFR